jgi:outer membrane protein assembly factor BamE (lipoprotein component of BamABCDE complex)
MLKIFGAKTVGMKTNAILKISEKISIVFLPCFLILIFTGCQTSQSSSPESYLTKTNDLSVTATNNVNKPAPVEELQTHFGLSLRDAQDKALKLEPGITQDEVILLLGKPDVTSAGTYGTQTQKPWNGITWYYRWGTLDSDPSNYKQLSIIFEKGLNTWVINSWQWVGL